MTPEQAQDLIRTPAWNAWLQGVMEQYVLALQGMQAMTGEDLARLAGSVKLLEHQINRAYQVAGVVSPLTYLYSGDWFRHWLGQEPKAVPQAEPEPDEESVWFERPPRSSGPVGV